MAAIMFKDHKTLLCVRLGSLLVEMKSVKNCWMAAYKLSRASERGCSKQESFASSEEERITSDLGLFLKIARELSPKDVKIDCIQSQPQSGVLFR